MTADEIINLAADNKIELDEYARFMLTDEEVKSILLENPKINISILEGMYPRSCYKLTLLEDKFRLDFGYCVFKEDESSRYFNIKDFGKTWELYKNYLAVNRKTYNKLTRIKIVSKPNDNRVLICNSLPDDQIYMYKFPYLYRIL